MYLCLCISIDTLEMDQHNNCCERFSRWEMSPFSIRPFPLTSQWGGGKSSYRGEKSSHPRHLMMLSDYNAVPADRYHIYPETENTGSGVNSLRATDDHTISLCGRVEAPDPSTPTLLTRPTIVAHFVPVVGERGSSSEAAQRQHPIRGRKILEYSTFDIQRQQT